MSTGLRAFGDLRLSYDLRVVPDFVLFADAADSQAYVEFDNGSAISSFWVEMEVGFFQAALDFWDGDGDAADVFMPKTAAIGNAVPAGVGGNGGAGDTIYWRPADSDVLVTASVYHTLKYHRNGTAITIFVDDVQIRSTTTGAAAVQFFRFGLDIGGVSDPSEQSYVASVKIGTTEGGTDIFQDDFSSGDLSAWTTTLGAVSAIDNPF